MQARYRSQKVEVLEQAGNLSRISYGTDYTPWVKTERLVFPKAKRPSVELSEEQYAWIAASGKLYASVTPLGLSKFVDRYERLTGIYIGLDPDGRFRMNVSPNRWWLSLSVTLPLEAIELLPIELGMKLEERSSLVHVHSNELGWELIERGMRL